MGCKSPVGGTAWRHERPTTRGQLRAGDRPGEARLRQGFGGSARRLGETGGPMNKNRIEGRPRRGELAQHNEAGRSSRGGSTRGGLASGEKCGGRAGKQRALTWGDPDGATRRGVSRGHSTRAASRGPEGPSKRRDRKTRCRGRAEPDRIVPPSERTAQPKTPEGEEVPSAAPSDDRGTVRSRP